MRLEPLELGKVGIEPWSISFNRLNDERGATQAGPEGIQLGAPPASGAGLHTVPGSTRRDHFRTRRASHSRHIRIQQGVATSLT